ncbi:MAG: ABC transporter ATP-binding protein [Ornithinimicrobium sp.]|uniref:ABC transporter ATP-binding protein n=1 Tax=Ornithinimicrobium sp. TaxID=1977084 RepID=UPI0026E01E6C|nr:ABC transporter ATP-binding protein [Ornithinimicrobium sp.]MDO5739300.1 ABC transporter ATP-binding protein [Ornithinimicrobium sp.]
MQTEQITAPPTVLVEAVNVTKSYRAGARDVEILHGVSLEVRAGEMCAVMGPSGSGKSTLLYTLAGLEAPTTGVVSLLGRQTRDLSRSQLAKLRRTDVGFVFQSYNLVPTLTAYENVALPFRLRGVRPPADQIRASLETVGLTKLAGSRPVVMSGGEQQRVALARVIAARPRIVFADEPTGALDTHSGAVVLNELRAIAHQADQCVLAVTHDPLVAAKCDRVLFLRDGYLVHELVQPEASEVAELLADLGNTQEEAAA